MDRTLDLLRANPGRLVPTLIGAFAVPVLTVLGVRRHRKLLESRP